MTIVLMMLLVLTVSNIKRWAVHAVAMGVLLVALAACGSAQTERTLVAAATPTPVATTAPLEVPTVTPVPTAPAPVLPVATAVPRATATPVAVATPLPVATATATAAPVAVDPTVAPTAAPVTVEATVAPTTAPAIAEATTAPTVEPTVVATTVSATVEATPDADPEPTAVVAPTAVVVSGELPLECYDTQVGLYRGFVDGVDTLSFDGGRVSCIGAATNAVSAPRSYRHSSGFVVNRNADYQFNDAGTGYINFSGAMHFCLNGQPIGAPFQSDTVPSLLIVIDNEARRLAGEGATPPSMFTTSGAQC